MSELKQKIADVLSHFSQNDLFQSSIQFFETLGYNTERQLPLEFPTFQNFKENYVKDNNRFKEQKAYTDNWKQVHLLFQLTEEELVSQHSLLKKNFKPEIAFSFLFFAIELNPKENNKPYTKTELSNITREVNKLFAMPAIILFKYDKLITLSIIHRRLNKRDKTKDVLEKVTLIKDINIASPHRGHIEILHNLAFSKLNEPEDSINNFEDLHKAWEKVLDTSILNKRFYKEIADWFYWARDKANFSKSKKDKQEANSLSIIRLLTRLIFVWFIKEKKMIPETLFDDKKLKDILQNFENPNKSKETIYYKAILQNLFFATLNTKLEERVFRDPTTGTDDNKHYMKHNVYRYERLVKNRDQWQSLFQHIPFLNGGLFECLDRPPNGDYKNMPMEKVKQLETRIDYFSDRDDNPLEVPDMLFFSVRDENQGLFHILNKYKFTVSENTPIEEEVALDPELLGKVFENLLAEYNPETHESARKSTGSFYTPREIVDYMATESLKNSLATTISEKLQQKQDDIKAGLELLFEYTEEAPLFDVKQKEAIVEAIADLKILDPACGSGAFPMGVLHKLVFVLEKVDPNNELWTGLQIKRVAQENKNLKKTKEILEKNTSDYGRKLFLIENCIYGVDIQPLAVEISKLRFFLSLIIEQDNHNVSPLPNLDFKFVCANTLISIPKDENQKGELFSDVKDEFTSQLEDLTTQYFYTDEHNKKEKIKQDLQKLIKNYVQKKEKSLSAMLEELIDTNESEYGKLAQKKRKQKNAKREENIKQSIDLWESYPNLLDNKPVKFFEPKYFFPHVKEGFDIVIGNPPYVQIQKFSGKLEQKQWEAQNYKTYNKMGDIYALFYEKGNQILKNKGVLVFITSNKWMRAGYGKYLRKFLAEYANPVLLIDFGGYKVFENATVDTNILIFEKNKYQNKTLACTIKDDFKNHPDIYEYVKKNGIILKNLSEESWIILNKKEYAIKKKIEKIGTPLKEWDIKIYRGVLTGFNKAFIIDGKTKDELIKQDPKSAEIIKPILRGRDIKRYHTEFADLWLIFIPWHFPLHNDHSISGASQKAEKEFEKQYPVIYKHFLQYKNKLEKRNKSETGIAYEWYALQRCAASYYEEFEKEKIVWGSVSETYYTFVDKETLLLDTNYFCIFKQTEINRYILALLNSKLIIDYINGKDTLVGTVAYRHYKYNFEKIPIPKIPKEEQKPFIELADQILKKKEKGEDTTEEENQIDLLVYKLYNLTYDEIHLIDPDIEKIVSKEKWEEMNNG